MALTDQEGRVREAAARLRSLLARAERGDQVLDDVPQIIAARDRVTSEYQPVFDISALPALSAEQFRGFLLFRNNQHWPLHRGSSALTSDMPRLRTALGILLDETRAIEDRLDTLTPSDRPPFLSGLGRNVATAILLLAHPREYGVWNGKSEAGLRMFGLIPQRDAGDSYGTQYRLVNEVLHAVDNELSVDLWTLDTLWWALSEAGVEGERHRDKRHFGPIPGVIVGDTFENRADLAASGVHPPTQAGISGSEAEGADSIVLSGGYEDDDDRGDTILYTGQDGNDPDTKRQVGHQVLKRGNLALARSSERGLPVRVTRGAHGGSAFAPSTGFRYDGVYRVE